MRLHQIEVDPFEDPHGRQIGPIVPGIHVGNIAQPLAWCDLQSALLASLAHGGIQHGLAGLDMALRQHPGIAARRPHEHHLNPAVGFLAAPDHPACRDFPPHLKGLFASGFVCLGRHLS